jgi:hypothetical protein
MTHGRLGVKKGSGVDGLKEFLMSGYYVVEILCFADLLQQVIPCTFKHLGG